MNRRSTRLGTLVLLVSTGYAAPLALAQSDPVLKGPPVKDRDVPGVVGEFGNSNQQRRFVDRMPPEVFRKALAVLTADDAPEDLKATSDQRTQFKELVEDFEKRVREYRRSHSKEIDELRKLAGDLPGPRGRDAKKGDKAPEKPDADDSMQSMSETDQKKRDEAKAKLRELMEGAPKIEEVYTKVWAGLTEPQRKAVDAELEKFRAEQSRQREDNYVKQRVKKEGGKPDAKPDAKADAKPGPKGDDEMMKPSPVRPDADAGAPPERPLASRLTPERRERLMRILSRMTPEEQDQLLERLEARLRDRAGPAGKDPERRPAKDAKPAPNPDDVKVPEPEKK